MDIEQARPIGRGRNDRKGSRVNEREYLADPTAGLDGTGRKVAFDFVPDAFCPICGEPLRYMTRGDAKGNRVRFESHVRSRKKRAADAVEVDRIVQKTKYVSKRVGTEWLHVYRYLCLNCGSMTESQRSLPPQVPPKPLPPFYYADGLPPAPEQAAAF